MKPAFLFVLSITGALLAESLGEVKSVYLLPMGHGLDQFLASRLTSEGVFTVTADPQAADAIITDRLGESLEARLDELYPPPAPAAKPDDAGKEESSDSKTGGDTYDRGERVGGMSTFGKGKGTIFVVDRKTRRVLWSTYEPSRSTAPEQLDRTAERIAEAMAKTLKRGSGKK